MVPAALAFLLLIALLNARGIRESMGANIVMTIIEVSGLVLVTLLEFTPGISPAVAVLGAGLLAFYSYVGFEVSANVA